MPLDAFNYVIASIILFCVLCIQIGTNFANDYYDYVKGADSSDRVGPRRMTQSGAIAPLTMKRATFLMFSMATLSGLFLVYHGGWPIFLIGLLSLFFGLIYTAGPFALAYIGGAEIISFLFFGPVSIIGTYLLTATWNLNLIFIGSGIGLITTALLVVNNTRDIDSDRKVNKKTLAVRFGPLFSYVEYIFCLYTPIILLDYVTENSVEQMIFILFLVFISMLLTKKFGKATSLIFNRLIGFTSAYLILYTTISVYLLS